MKKSDLLRAISFSSLAVAAAALSQAFSQFDKLYKEDFFEFHFDNFILIAAAYSTLAVMLGVFSSDISRVFRNVMRTPRVVIMHDLENREVIKDITVGLTTRGISVWNDMSDAVAGDEIFSAIDAKVRDSDALIIFVAPNPPDYISHVVDVAIANKVRIIPISRAGFEPPKYVSGLVPLFQESGADQMLDELIKSIHKGRRSKKDSALSISFKAGH